jgi:hypothetical protein
LSSVPWPLWLVQTFLYWHFDTVNTALTVKA